MNVEELAKEFGYQSEDAPQASATPSVVPSNDKFENLASEFGYDPNYKEPEKQHQSFWQGLANDPQIIFGSVVGIGRRLGVGALRGAKDVLDTGAEALAKGTSAVADRVLPESLASPIRTSATNTIAEDKAARESFSKEYPQSPDIIPNATDIGRIGGQIAATLPIMPTKLIQGVNSAVGALPTITATGQRIAAPIINRLTGAAGTGAVGGGVLGASTSSTNDKSLAENVGEGAITGAIGGPLIEGAGSVGGKLAGKLIGNISPTRAALAERALQLGIDLDASQVSTSPFIKKLDQVSGWLPFSGAQGISDKLLGQFNRAVSRTFGKDAEEITPDVVKQGLKDIGDKMNTFRKGVTVNADASLQKDFIDIAREASTNLQESEVRPIFNKLREVAQMIDPNTNTMTGDIYHNIMKYDGLLSKLQQNSNPNIANAANRIEDALDNAMSRSITPAQRQEWGNLKLQYKSGKTAQELIENDQNGVVSPMKLLRKVSQSPGGRLGSGELGEIADIGRAFFAQPKDSGTPLGNLIADWVAPAVHNPATSIAAGSAALLQGLPIIHAIEGGAGLVANRAMREVLNSKMVRDSIINTGKGSTFGKTNAFVQALEPYSSKLMERKKDEPLRITVTPK